MSSQQETCIGILDTSCTNPVSTYHPRSQHCDFHWRAIDYAEELVEEYPEVDYENLLADAEEEVRTDIEEEVRADSEEEARRFMYQ